MKLYKLTNKDNITHGNFKWVLNKNYYIEKEKRRPVLCSDGVFHAYKDINLALLLNPIHAGIKNPNIFEAEGDIVVEDYNKVGTYELKLTKEIPIPDWYRDNNIRNRVCVQFAILCAESVVHLYNNKYPKDDRPNKAIRLAKDYLKGEVSEALVAAYAAYADDAAYAAAADAAAARAAYAAYAAAARAIYVTCDAAYDTDGIDFIALANKAVELIITTFRKKDAVP